MNLSLGRSHRKNDSDKVITTIQHCGRKSLNDGKMITSKKKYHLYTIHVIVHTEQYKVRESETSYDSFFKTP